MNGTDSAGQRAEEAPAVFGGLAPATAPPGAKTLHALDGFESGAGSADGGTGQLDDLAAALAAIDAFAPNFPRKRWDPIAGFVRDSVRACLPLEVLRVTALMSTTARFVDWSRRQGVPLKTPSIFDLALIEQYRKASEPGVGSATAGNRRSHLKAMASTLNPATLGPETTPTRASSGCAPYNSSEVAQLWRWADRQATPEIRRDARILIAGGLAAGLTGAEVCELRGQDVQIDGGGVVLTVSGPRPRRVPVLQEFAHVFIDAAADTAAGDFVFRPGRTGTPKNTASNFLARCSKARVEVSTQRTRATWVVRHLGRPMRLEALMQAMGVTDFSAIARYLEHTPALDEDDFLTQLWAA